MFKNEMELKFAALSENQAFARVVAAAFATRLNPTVAEITEIKTAVSEAVTNAIIHGYDGLDGAAVIMRGYIKGREILIEIEDAGRGIEDIEQAREPLFTTKPDEERSGMGFTVMEEFMDSLEVESEPGRGTIVKMRKIIGG
ncbi:MAG: anti-sigma F factor [Clostridiales bacterium]|jgi:stage II sporulation protein AB (anti-sigma F factor)|nr:anti-sigma F factor [Clostridiales bacterium]